MDRGDDVCTRTLPYLKRYARQNHSSGGAKRFVATPPPDAPARILGFYTLSQASIEFGRAPSVVTHELGRYEIPVYCLGRLSSRGTDARKRLGAS